MKHNGIPRDRKWRGTKRPLRGGQIIVADHSRIRTIVCCPGRAYALVPDALQASHQSFKTSPGDVNGTLGTAAPLNRDTLGTGIRASVGGV